MSAKKTSSRSRSLAFLLVIIALLTIILCFLLVIQTKRDLFKERQPENFASWMFAMPSLSVVSKLWNCEFSQNGKDISTTSASPSTSSRKHVTVQTDPRRPPPERKDGNCSVSIPDDYKFDCHPESDASEEKCTARGCCWEAKAGAAPSSSAQSLGVPSCFYPTNYPGYVVTKKKEDSSGIVVDMTRSTSTYYPGTVRNIRMMVYLETPQRLHVKVCSRRRGSCTSSLEGIKMHIEFVLYYLMHCRYDFLE